MMKKSTQRALLAPVFIDASDEYLHINSAHDGGELWLATPCALRRHKQRETLREFAALATLLLLWFLAEPVWAGAESAMMESSATGGQAPYRSLWLKTADGVDVSDTLSLSTDISMRISGPILRATVKQRFRNPTQSWVEGVYSFPLPGASRGRPAADAYWRAGD